MTNTQLFINGRFRDSSDGKRIPQMNPATEEVFTEVAAATLADVGVAVEGAQQAFVGGWGDLTPRNRTERPVKVAPLVPENAGTPAPTQCPKIRTYTSR